MQILPVLLLLLLYSEGSETAGPDQRLKINNKSLPVPLKTFDSLVC